MSRIQRLNDAYAKGRKHAAKFNHPFDPGYEYSPEERISYKQGWNEGLDMKIEERLNKNFLEIFDGKMTQ